MIRYLFALLFICLSTSVWAEEQLTGLEISKANINRTDVESIKRGAKFFAINCMSCHTMVYLRYNKLAQEAGITLDKMPLNVKSWPYDVVPPDLSLEVNRRGINWIYTYLHSFYQDSSRPTGVNNLLVPNTAMPNIIAPYQGTQELVKDPLHDLLGHVRWYDMVKLTKQGMMTPEAFDATIDDLVNFLAYAAEPFHAEQEKIGYWVLGFLFIFLIMMVFLKREYWKDVKKRKND